MVYPILSSETYVVFHVVRCVSDIQYSSVDEVNSLLAALMPRLHVLIVGPGLGRETHMQAFARLAIQQARELGLYLVFDADALLLIQDDPEIIRGYTKAVITPNVAEFSKLCEAVVSLAYPSGTLSHVPYTREFLPKPPRRHRLLLPSLMHSVV